LRFTFRTSLGSPPRRGALAWITQWLVNAVGLALVARTVNGVGLRVDGGRLEAPLAVLGASAVLGLLNLLVKPLLLVVTLPVNLLTLGLFTLLINGLVLWMVAALVPAFSIAGFWTAVWAALCFSAFTLLLNALLGGATLSLRTGRGR
jgi:putative membrane protein